jgi:hypothetical protein
VCGSPPRGADNDQGAEIAAPVPTGGTRSGKGCSWTLGALAVVLLVSAGASWWRAGRQGLDALGSRDRDRRIDGAQAEYRAGPRNIPPNGGGTSG